MLQCKNYGINMNKIRNIRKEKIMVELCELIIKDTASRDSIILALVNNGYTVSVDEEKQQGKLIAIQYKIKVKI